MSMPLENAKANLRTASRNVAERLGVDPMNMSYEQRRAYNAALKAEILRYPESFTPEIVAIAEKVQDDGALDMSSAWGEFAPELTGNVVPVLNDFTNKLLITAVILGVVWIVVNQRPGGPSPAVAA